MVGLDREKLRFYQLLILFTCQCWVIPDSTEAAWSSPGAHVVWPPPTTTERNGLFTSLSAPYCSQCEAFALSPLGKATSPEHPAWQTLFPGGWTAHRSMSSVSPPTLWAPANNQNKSYLRLFSLHKTHRCFLTSVSLILVEKVFL